MPIEVARATAEDWRALREIRLRALAEAPYAFGSTLQRELAFPETTWRERADTNHIVVARLDHELVGTATGHVDPADLPGDVQLVAMYVAPPARGTGTAHRLIDAVARQAQAADACSVRLHVTEVNAPALACYLRYGFQLTGRTQALPHSPHLRELEMLLPLPLRSEIGPLRDRP